MYRPRTGTVSAIKYLEKPENRKAQMDSGAGSIGLSAASLRHFCHSLTNVCSVGESIRVFPSAILIVLELRPFTCQNIMLKYLYKLVVSGTSESLKREET